MTRRTISSLALVATILGTLPLSGYTWRSSAQPERNQRGTIDAVRISQINLRGLADGNYLFSDSSNTTGNEFVLFRKQGNIAVGNYFKKGTDLQFCFKGTIQKTNIMNIVQAYDTENSRTSATGPQKFNSGQPINLQKMYQLKSNQIPNGIERINSCVKQYNNRRS